MEDKNGVDFLNKVQCPVCLDIPDHEIFQCEDGHPVCHRCYQSLTSCPQCRSVFGKRKIRNRVLEDLLDSKKFCCPNREHGCTEMLNRQEITNHAETCQFRQSFQLCNLLGLKCRFVVEVSNMSGAFQHYDVSHKVPFCKTGAAKMVLMDFFPVACNGNTIWSPLIFDFVKYGSKCLLVCKINPEDKTFSVSCISFAPPEDEQRTRCCVKFDILGSTKENNITWTAYPVKIKSLTGINLNPMRIPLYLLQQNYLAEGNISISVGMVNPQELENSETKKSLPEETEVDLTPAVYMLNKIPDKDVLGASPDVWINRHGIRFSCEGCQAQQNFAHAFYQCMTCSDRYYLCEDCKSRGVHSEHVFVLVENVSNYTYMIEYTMARIGEPRLLQRHVGAPVSPSPAQGGTARGRVFQ